MEEDDDLGSARILSFEQARTRLSRFWELLAQLPHRALDRYKRQVAARFALPSARFRSTAIQELMVDEVRRAARDDLFRRRGRWVLRADDNLIVQFKKVTAGGRTINLPTPAALQWETQLNLPGIPSAMRVTLGYRLNCTNTEVAEVCLIARDGDTVIWRESIESQSSQLTIATPIRATESRPVVRRLAAKPEALAARVTKKKDRKRGD